MKRRFLFLLPLLLCSCGAASSVTLKWVNPSVNAAAGTCNVPSTILTDLKQVTLYCRMVGAPDSIVLGSRPGRAGVADSFTVAVQETLWDFWAVWSDSAGNRSCSSNIIRKRISESPAPGILQ